MDRTTWQRPTCRHLRSVCAVAFAEHPGGETRGAAGALGVSQRTVQRWLAGDPAGWSPVPAARWEQLREIAAPHRQAMEQEAREARRAARDVGVLGTPARKADQARWAAQGWDAPHVVTVLEVDAGGELVQQLVTYRATRAADAEVRRRGQVLSLEVVPSRFHARLVAHRVLERRGPWRVRASRWVRRGGTWVWTRWAPRVILQDDVYITLTDLEG